VEAVSKVIGDERALNLLKDNIVERRLRWYEKNKKNLKISENPVDNAYNIMTERLKIIDDADIYIRGDRSMTFRTSKPCPVHEACKILGMDSKRICKAVCEGSANDFLQKLDPKIRFTIDHKKKGPEEFTIETIELKQED